MRLGRAEAVVEGRGSRRRHHILKCSGRCIPGKGQQEWEAGRREGPCRALCAAQLWGRVCVQVIPCGQFPWEMSPAQAE